MSDRKRGLWPPDRVEALRNVLMVQLADAGAPYRAIGGVLGTSTFTVCRSMQAMPEAMRRSLETVNLAEMIGTVFDAEFHENFIGEFESVRALGRTLGGTDVLSTAQIIDKATVRAGEFPVAAAASPSDEG